MAVDWEETFRNWSKPSSDTESEKAKNAERMIRDAIKNSEALSQHKITIFAQGSYKNNTNVRKDSDVDICVRCDELICPDYSHTQSMNNQKAGLSQATYNYRDFKNDLEKALVKKFGRNSITRGNKAFDVHENTYRINADVVPTLIRRLYYEDGTYREGTQIRTDDGTKINNWPQQHYDNGINKNNRTDKRFKCIVRGVKRLRVSMEERGIKSAAPIPSFLVECLVYLVPDTCFSDSSYKTNVENCIIYLHDNIDQAKWTEINGIKYLFHVAQKWSKSEVKAFLHSASYYIQNN